jgi:hypothetical protein
MLSEVLICHTGLEHRAKVLSLEEFEEAHQHGQIR